MYYSRFKIASGMKNDFYLSSHAVAHFEQIILSDNNKLNAIGSYHPLLYHYLTVALQQQKIQDFSASHKVFAELYILRKTSIHIKTLDDKQINITMNSAPFLSMLATQPTETTIIVDNARSSKWSMTESAATVSMINPSLVGGNQERDLQSQKQRMYQLTSTIISPSPSSSRQTRRPSRGSQRCDVRRWNRLPTTFEEDSFITESNCNSQQQYNHPCRRRSRSNDISPIQPKRQASLTLDDQTISSFNQIPIDDSEGSYSSDELL
jgi:hypothetical protein